MKKYRLISLLLITVIIFSACGGSGTGDNYKRVENYDASTPAERPVEDESADQNSVAGQGGETNLNIPAGRKIIVTYNLHLETKEYDAAMENLNKLIDSYKGLRTQIEEYNYNSRSINLTVQIPSDKAGEFVGGLESIKELKLQEKNLSSEDVTDQYTDTELRLSTLRDKLARLNELKSEQSDLESLLALETEISNTILDIERIEGSLRALDSKIDYTTIHMYINEISTAISTPVRTSFADRLSAAFFDSIDNFVYGIQELIIGLIYLLPQLVILGIIIAILVLVIRPIYRKFFKGKMPKKEKFNDLGIRRNYKSAQNKILDADKEDGKEE